MFNLNAGKLGFSLSLNVFLKARHDMRRALNVCLLRPTKARKNVKAIKATLTMRFLISRSIKIFKNYQHRIAKLAVITYTEY